MKAEIEDGREQKQQQPKTTPGVPSQSAELWLYAGEMPAGPPPTQLLPAPSPAPCPLPPAQVETTSAGKKGGTSTQLEPFLESPLGAFAPAWAAFSEHCIHRFLVRGPWPPYSVRLPQAAF